jgi:uncharacterized membrane protein
MSSLRANRFGLFSFIHAERFPHTHRLCQVVQALMGVLAILSLVYKRNREKPKRPWQIWYFGFAENLIHLTGTFSLRLFDVSKQVVGQMFVHGLNVLISNVGSHHKSGSNACVFYFLNILLDTTIGAHAFRSLSCPSDNKSYRRWHYIHNSSHIDLSSVCKVGF